MLRRLLRGVLVAIAVLTGLAAAALVGGWIWLRSDAGQRFVLERLAISIPSAYCPFDRRTRS